MNDFLVIFGIALVVVVLAFLVWFIRIKMDGRKQRAKMHERRVEDAEREALLSDAWGNVVKPPDDNINWERRYAELVEDVSRRTDQAKGKA
jgi:hypothetical protein